MMPRYEVLEHTADLALRIYGQNLHELFINAAYAMFNQLSGNALEHITPSLHHRITVEGNDCESLLVNWLNELLYWHETRREVYSTFEIEQLSPQHLRATVRGAPNKDVQIIIKAATFHDLAIQRTAEGYQTTVVFDV